MLLEMKDVSKWFPPGHLVLNHLNLSMEKGEKVLVTGRGGSGRTCMLRMIWGDMRADEGRITLEGKCAFVPENPGLLDSMTLREHLALPLWGAGCGGKESRSRTDGMMEALGLVGRGEVKSAQLSDYERTLLVLGQALLQETSLLAVDEILKKLSASERERVLKALFGQLGERGLIMVSDGPLLPEAFDRILSMDELQR